MVSDVEASFRDFVANHSEEIGLIIGLMTKTLALMVMMR